MLEIVPSCILVASIAALALISALTIEPSTIFEELTELLASLASVTLASAICAVSMIHLYNVRHLSHHQQSLHQ